MIVKATSRATGPFGEINRGQHLSSENIPQEYLQHLIEIGVAERVGEYTKPPVKKKKESPEETSSASQQAPASPEPTAKKRRGRQRKSSL